MKAAKCSITSLFFLLAFVFVQCKPKAIEQKKEVEINNNYDAYESFDLSEFDINATMMLPDATANIGASTTPEVTHEEDGFKWDIEKGPNFKLHIEDWGANRGLVENKKMQNKDQDVYEIRYLIDKPNFIVYEAKLKVAGEKKASSQVGVPHISYHVFSEVIVDGITYEFRSFDEGIDKNYIEFIAKTIRSVKAIK